MGSDSAQETGQVGVSPGEDARPIPPRYWWLRRLGLLGVAFVLGLLGVRWWWGCEAERRLQAKIAEYRAGGQPVLLEDFTTEPIPDEDNAALLLLKAAAKCKKPPVARYDVDDFSGDPQLFVEAAADLASLIEANQEALRLLHEARDKPGADWGVPLVSPVINTFLPSLSGQRELAKLVCVTAEHQHCSGDDQGAVDTLRDALALGGHLGQGQPFLIPYLVRAATDALAIQRVETIATSLRVADEPNLSQPAPRPASRAQVRALIDDLLDERSTRAGWLWAMYGERMLHLDAVECLIDGRLTWPPFASNPRFGPAWLPNRPLAWAVGPMWKLDGVRMIESDTDVAEALAAPSWPAAQPLLPPLPPSSDVRTLRRMLSRIFLPSLDRAVQNHFRSLAQRRMAASALAIRLYEVDHGHRPAKLSELVPAYLAAVPLDPFAADDREIGYAPDAPQPVLYSVGLDGVDDGGRFAIRSGSVERDALDQPFFLNGDRPRRKWSVRPSPAPTKLSTQPASSQAVVDDQQVKDAKGGQQNP